MNDIKRKSIAVISEIFSTIESGSTSSLRLWFKENIQNASGLRRGGNLTSAGEKRKDSGHNTEP